MTALAESLPVTIQPTLRVVTTHCQSCKTVTPERVIVDRWIRTAKENLRFGGKLRIVECCDCGLQYLNPMPHPDDLGTIYDFTHYEDSTNENPVLMEHFYAQMRKHAPRSRRVLEIGCGKGDFLVWLQGKGLDCEGVEFAESAQQARVFTGRMHYSRMEDIDLPAQSFDVILLLNTIEHLADPAAVLRKIYQMLRPGGVLLLRHPNGELFTFPPYRYTVELAKLILHKVMYLAGRNTFSLMGFRSQHLFYFTRETVTRMLTANGFTVRQVTTDDPYNRYVRMPRAWRRGQFIQAGIAGLRHLLGRYGLGPEILTIASR